MSHLGQQTPWRSASSASPTNARSARSGLRAARQQNPSSARSLALSAPRPFQPKLAPSEVTSVLRNNEYTCSDLPAGPIKFFDTNTLQSNDPIEDSYASALTVGGGYLFGIFDGHGGAACGQVPFSLGIFEPYLGQLLPAQVVAKRLLHYIAAGLLSPADLAKHRDVWLDGKKESLVMASASFDFLFSTLFTFRCGFSMITLNWYKISNNFINGAMLNILLSCR